MTDRTETLTLAPAPVPTLRQRAQLGLYTAARDALAFLDASDAGTADQLDFDMVRLQLRIAIALADRAGIGAT